MDDETWKGACLRTAAATMRKGARREAVRWAAVAGLIACGVPLSWVAAVVWLAAARALLAGSSLADDVIRDALERKADAEVQRIWRERLRGVQQSDPRTGSLRASVRRRRDGSGRAL